MGTSPNNIKPKRADQLKRLGELIVGLQKHEHELAPFNLAGKQYTVAQVIAALQGRVTATQAAVTTRAAWQAAVKVDHEGRAGGQVFLAGVRATLLAAYAGSVDSLADFGLVGPKPRVVSPKTQVAAAAKVKATRIARHTMGPKQKAHIHGTVATSAPETSPAAAAPASVAAPPAATAPTGPSSSVAAPPAATVPTAPSPSVAVPPATPPAPPHS